MDVLIFLTVVTFQVTLLAIVAIVFGQSKIAEQAIGGLTNILRNFTLKRKQLSQRKSKQTTKPSPNLKPSFKNRRTSRNPSKAIPRIVKEQEETTDDIVEIEG